jgi:DNA-binding XRE family transcriptional regulator
MPSIVDNMTISDKTLDRRVKLSDNDKLLIKSLYDEGNTSQRKLARDFNVSRRTIQFILDPEKQRRNYEKRLEKGGSKQYYDKDKNTESMRKHRAHKKDLLNKGLIGCKNTSTETTNT